MTSRRFGAPPEVWIGSDRLVWDRDHADGGGGTHYVRADEVERRVRAVEELAAARASDLEGLVDGWRRLTDEVDRLRSDLADLRADRDRWKARAGGAGR